jgi:predicted transcriptional regulator
MINIKKFIDRVATIEGRQGKDVVITLVEARALRDEISKLIIDLQELKESQPAANEPEVIQVVYKGGKW